MKLINITTAKFEGHTLLCDVIGCERGMLHQSPSGREGGVLGCCWETTAHFGLSRSLGGGFICLFVHCFCEILEINNAR